IPSRTSMGILFLHVEQTYFGVLGLGYILWPQWQTVKPENKATGAGPGRLYASLRSSRMRLASSHISTGMMASTLRSTQSSRGLIFHALPLPMFLLKLMIWTPLAVGFRMRRLTVAYPNLNPSRVR